MHNKEEIGNWFVSMKSLLIQPSGVGQVIGYSVLKWLAWIWLEAP